MTYPDWIIQSESMIFCVVINLPRLVFNYTVHRPWKMGHYASKLTEKKILKSVKKNESKLDLQNDSDKQVTDAEESIYRYIINI